MNCAIVGAGQLGSRHLQGLLTFNQAFLEIFILDTSKESLLVAQQRANEIKHAHKLYFISSMQELPKQLEFVVVATNSMVRLTVMERLCQQATIKNLILEKVLFPDIEQYAKALNLVRENQVSCWVNHPRRMYEAYQKLKTFFDFDKTYSFQLVGASWGLACNGLHFIDLFEFLTNSKLSAISNALLDGQPIESKRSGYFEFEGTLTGTLNDKHNFSITSLKNHNVIAPTISIMTDELRVLIQESATPKVYIFRNEKNFTIEEFPFQVHFQSQLSGKLLEQILSSGTCDLPTFEHASSTHQIFIESILRRWNEVTKTKNVLLPIT
ncbi:hypothetical protein MASR2M44_13990 [Bacteroidota bacterium]